MKKLHVLILSIMLLTLAVLGLSACGHQHDYKIKSTELVHWVECDCGDIREEEKHAGGEATCTEKAKCSTCGAEYGKLGDHAGGEATCKEKAKCSTCGAEYGELGGHAGGEATCTEKAKCSTCNEEYGKLSNCKYEQGNCKWCKKEQSEGLNFSLVNGEYQVTGIGSFSGSDLYIPSIHLGKSVTSIGNEAFSGCEYLATIEIPNSVKSIGDKAFYECAILYSVKLPDNMVSIGSSAFENCSHLYKIKIPEGVSTLEDALFCNCIRLEEVVIPNSVTSIGDSVFAACYALEFKVEDDIRYLGNATNPYLYLFGVESVNKNQLTINSNCKFIGPSAFMNCKYLTDIEIPVSVTNIYRSAFAFCDSLRKVNYPGTIEQWAKIYFGNKDSNPIQYCKSLYLNEQLVTEINLKTVNKINGYAFYNCEDLLSVELPDGVTAIGEFAFYGCINLKSVLIPNNVNSIGERAFSNCRSLTSVKIPESVTSMGSAVFEESYASTIYCEAKNKPSGWNNAWSFMERPVVWDCNNNEVASDGYIYVMVNGLRFGIKNNTATPLRQAANLKEANIPSWITYKGAAYGVSSIGRAAFMDCFALISVVIPDCVTSIGECAFDGSAVERATMPAFAIPYMNRLTLKEAIITSGDKIGDSAFRVFSKLSSVVIPNSVTSIGVLAFAYCESLKSVVIPDSVTSIGEYAFDGCSSLESITFSDPLTWYCTTNVRDWYNKWGGEQISVTNSSTNATYFNSTYRNYYWYKK